MEEVFTKQEILISEVLITSILMSASAKAPNILAAIPGLPSIPTPTMETFATSSSTRTAMAAAG